MCRFSTFTTSSNFVKVVLDHLPTTTTIASDHQSSAPQPKVANLKDIISKRGACGVGFITNLENKASYGIVRDAFIALGCMEHRRGCGADNDSGDDSGLMK